MQTYASFSPRLSSYVTKLIRVVFPSTWATQTSSKKSLVGRALQVFGPIPGEMLHSFLRWILDIWSDLAEEHL